MPAEQLLKSLLDSRSQPTAVTGNSVGPTRIRILNGLKRMPHTASELAEELSISRQTVYQSFPVCIESGLIREDADEYTLTCAGAYLLKRYHRFTNHERITILPMVARSKHRRWVLRTLSERESRRATLTAIAKEDQNSSPSRSTIYRLLKEFTREGYLDDSNGAYVVSEDGARFLQKYERLVGTIERILTAKAFLRWLPAEFEDFPIEVLEDTDMICNTLKQPHLCLNAFIEAADPDVETFHGIGTIFSPTLAQAYRPVFRGDGNSRILFTDDILFELHRNQEFIQFVKEQGYASFIKQGLYGRNAELRFVPGELPLHIVVCDEERVVMTPAPSTGVVESEATGIVSTDPKIVQWALAYFERIYTRGRSPLRAFFDNAVGRQEVA